jgi:hypothetical protein|tara:strand:+ start:1777 stop:2124 length:348 start_codon:yes stop_codon:yes gene_type:complete
MLQWLPESGGDLICLKASGRVTDADYRAIVPQLDVVLSNQTGLRLFGDFSDFEGWEWAQAQEKFSFGRDDLKKIAILGHEFAKELAVLAEVTLKDTEVRFFDADDKNAALIWVKQ